VGRLAAPLEEGGLPNLRCIVPQISSVGGAPNRGVPALFMHMSRDEHTTSSVARDLEKLRQQGIRASDIRVDPQPVTEEMLGRCLSQEVAADVMAALRAGHHIDEKGMLLESSRERHWVPPVKEALAGRSDDTLQPDESCLAELLNVAWAQHEIMSQHAEEMLDFCEEGKGELAAAGGGHPHVRGALTPGSE